MHGTTFQLQAAKRKIGAGFELQRLRSVFEPQLRQHEVPLPDGGAFAVIGRQTQRHGIKIFGRGQIFGSFKRKARLLKSLIILCQNKPVFFKVKMNSRPDILSVVYGAVFGNQPHFNPVRLNPFAAAELAGKRIVVNNAVKRQFFPFKLFQHAVQFGKIGFFPFLFAITLKFGGIGFKIARIASVRQNLLKVFHNNHVVRLNIFALFGQVVLVFGHNQRRFLGKQHFSLDGFIHCLADTIGLYPKADGFFPIKNLLCGKTGKLLGHVFGKVFVNCGIGIFFVKILSDSDYIADRLRKSKPLVRAFDRRRLRLRRIGGKTRTGLQ